MDRATKTKTCNQIARENISIHRLVDARPLSGVGLLNILRVNLRTQKCLYIGWQFCTATDEQVTRDRDSGGVRVGEGVLELAGS
jgi:hypothetical protein